VFHLIDVCVFQNETKGKAIDLATILRNNPNLAPLPVLNNKTNARTAPAPEIIEVPKPMPPPKEHPETTLPKLTRHSVAPKQTTAPSKQELAKPTGNFE
jgi:hypothetical protein